MAVVPPDIRTVTVDLPSEVFDATPWEPGTIAGEMRVLWLIEQVRTRRLGHGKAAELAGFGRERFLELMGVHGVSAFDLDVEDLSDEVAP
jgi:hypothetical protein